MQNFSLWLISESIERLQQYKPIINIVEKHKIPPLIVDNILQLAAARDEKEQIPYAQYLLGFYTKKTNAFREDYLIAIDNYTFYRRNKQRLYPTLNGQPFEVGQQNDEIKYIKDHNVSNTRAKKQGRILDGVDMSRVTEEKFGEYTFYTIPKATNDVEKLNNKQLYCLLGKGTNWCTAAPDGTYYEHYVNKLDITIIYKNGKPLFQFGLHSDPNHIDGIVQFMDVQDQSSRFIPQDLYEYIDKSKYSPILKLKQFDKMTASLKFDDLPFDRQKALVIEDPEILQLVKNPSLEIQKVAVSRDVNALRYIQNQHEDVKIMAVKKGSVALRYIDNPSEEILKIALSRNPEALKEIPNPSEEIKKMAVKYHGSAIRNIKKPSEEIQEISVKKDPKNIQFINNPSIKIQLLAVKANGFAIKDIINPEEEVQLAAVNQQPTAISGIKNPSDKVQKKAIDKDPFAIQNIVAPSEEMVRYAISKDYKVANYIRNLSPELKDFVKSVKDRLSK